MCPTLPVTPSEFAQQLKAALAIEQVVAEYIPELNRSGTSFKGRCPFHKEKTASFYVHPEQAFYHCFGCGAHGDVIRFVQEMEKVDFIMALELLARRAGLTLPSFRTTGEGESEERDKRLALLREVCVWAENFFIEQLHRHPKGAAAREYFIRRGLTDEQIKEYRLGYAPDGYEVLLRAAEKHGWRPETVAEAGLASRREQGGFIDRFRDRVMFSITDRMGQVVAFAGRLLENIPDAAKYINTADTPLFHKSSLLYGLARAREAIKTEERVIVLEGYMDWLALHRRGIRNVLAGMGTALTDEQARLIKRMTGHVTLIYDGDAPGQKAMFRATEMLLRLGLEVRAAVLPAEHDPDSYIAANDVQAMRDILAQAPLALDYFINKIGQTSELTRPEGKADAVGRLAPLLLAIEDPALREGYQERAAGRFGLRLETLEAALRRRTVRRTGAPSGDVVPASEDDEFSEKSTTNTEISRSEQNLLYILLQKKEQWELLQRVEPEWFQSELLRSLFERLYDCQRDIREGGEPPEDYFSFCANEGEKRWLSRIILLPAQRFDGEVVDFERCLNDALQLQILKMKKQWVSRRKRELIADLNIIRGDTPIGTGQLQDVHRLSKENIFWHDSLLERPGSDEGSGQG